jgi:hypothetical protein
MHMFPWKHLFEKPGHAGDQSERQPVTTELLVAAENEKDIPKNAIQDLRMALEERMETIDPSHYSDQEFFSGDIKILFDAEGRSHIFVGRGGEEEYREISERGDLKSDSAEGLSVSFAELEVATSRIVDQIIQNETEEERLKASFGIVSRGNSELEKMVAEEKIVDKSPVTFGELSVEFIEGNLTLVRTVGNRQEDSERIEDVPSIVQGISPSELSKFYDEAKAELLLRKMRQVAN